MIALQTRLLRMRIRMRDRNDFVRRDRLRTFASVSQNRDEFVLRRVVERILKTLLDLATALRLMLHVPMRGLGDRLDRGNQIAITELRLDLEEIRHAMVNAAVKRDRPRRGAERIRYADHFKFVVKLAADDLNHLPQ